jgi:5,10-methylenetetrahydromethanopterin reductase
MTKVDLGVVPRLAAPEVVELCVEAERLGFDGVWVSDSQSVFREVYTILGAVAARTERILLSTGVTNPITRHPAVLAGAHSTLAELAPGRVILALGRGESSVRTAGLPAATLERMGQAVVALRSLLAGETATWRGVEIHMGYETIHVPVYVTASGPKMMRLGGRLADGLLFQVGVTPELVRFALTQIEAGAREGGRGIDDIALCMRVGCCVADDASHAREQMRAYAAAAAKTVFDSIPEEHLPAKLVEDVRALREEYDYYQQADSKAKHREFLTDQLIDAVAIAGSPGEVASRIRELMNLGLDRIVLSYAGPDARHQANRLAGVALRSRTTQDSTSA